MPEEFYSLIVTYTFHDDAKRNDFRSLLKGEHKNLVELDESTYGIIKGDWAKELDVLGKICEKIKATPDDSVDLFCSGSHACCENEKQRIKRIRINIKQKK